MLHKMHVLPCYKEIRRLKRENKNLQKQLLFLAEQCFSISKQYGQITYGGDRVYIPPYNNINEWLQAAKNKRVSHRNE